MPYTVSGAPSLGFKSFAACFCKDSLFELEHLLITGLSVLLPYERQPAPASVHIIPLPATKTNLRHAKKDQTPT